ncbi:zinc/manganese transport system permease protein [Paracoccus tibetensis]|uniref:Zinc/manganese transport system permease protein n=2 Tax=Paracoccus tibetensis TaxID=336292 RepID=A0A1G5HNU1_9RHOB|nr:zinc/manganese transport system permease protein [Paracoccus tibetensis]
MRTERRLAGRVMWELAVAPFAEFAFMQRALAGALMLSLAACPVGVFLMLRRMSLTGDAMAHAILPGAAAGFLIYGLEIWPMTLGGLIAGAVVAVGAGAVARLTVQHEDASMAAFYLISLSVGVVMVSLRGSSVDLMHVLFGTVLALDDAALVLIGLVLAVTALAFGLLWRALVAECLDPLFLRSVSRMGTVVHFGFLALVVLNLVAGFQALGTLLAVGLMILPAAAARFWTQAVLPMVVLAVAIGAASSALGLLLSYHFSLPSGPSITLSAGAVYLMSVLIGPRGLLLPRLPRRNHRTA